MLEEIPEAIKKLNERHHQMTSAKGLKAAREFKPNDSDIIVAGSPKSGTSWTQHILHGLRSRGNLDFEAIGKAVPVIELCYSMGFHDPYSTQRFKPNCLKSHMRYDLIPKGKAKHIIIIRNPADVAVSRFYYWEDWYYKKGELSLSEFVDWLYVKPCPPYDLASLLTLSNYIAKAYPHRKDEGVLWLHFEDLKADVKACIKLISDFTGIGVGDQELLDLIEHQSSFEFMKEHKDQFEVTFIKKWTMDNYGFPENEEAFTAGSKIRQGAANQSKQDISPQQLMQINNRWKEVVMPVCGYASYHEMRDGINKELGRSFKTL